MWFCASAFAQRVGADAEAAGVVEDGKMVKANLTQIGVVARFDGHDRRRRVHDQVCFASWV